jgi:hypothetical protein
MIFLSILPQHKRYRVMFSGTDHRQGNGVPHLVASDQTGKLRDVIHGSSSNPMGKFYFEAVRGEF